MLSRLLHNNNSLKTKITSFHKILLQDKISVYNFNCVLSRVLILLKNSHVMCVVFRGEKFHSFSISYGGIKCETLVIYNWKCKAACTLKSDSGKQPEGD